MIQLEYTHQHEDHEDLRRSKQYCSDWIKKNECESENSARVFRNVNETYEYLKNAEDEFHILITGSLHLVGAFLTILDPDSTTLSR